MEKRYKTYLKFVLAVTFVLVAGIAVTNYKVNPYGIYTDYREGDVFPASGTYSRLHKTERIKRLKPNALIIGTSRADIGVDPKQEFFPGLTPYNAALSASTIYEHRKMIEFAHRIQPLKKVVLALDFFTFNTRRMENKHFQPELVSDKALEPVQSLVNTYGTMVALDTLVVTFKHMRYMKILERRSFPSPNGQKLHNQGAWRAKKRGVQHMFRKPPNEIELPITNFTFNYSDTPGDDTFQHFQAILDLAKKEKIDLYFYISPVHKTHLQTLEARGKWPLYNEWKRRIMEALDGTPYPLWDFGIYNHITNETIPPEGDLTQMRWFWDTNHYKTEVGDIVLRKVVLGEDIYPAFGMRLH